MTRSMVYEGSDKRDEIAQNWNIREKYGEIRTEKIVIIRGSPVLKILSFPKKPM